MNHETLVSIQEWNESYIYFSKLVIVFQCNRTYAFLQPDVPSAITGVACYRRIGNVRVGIVRVSCWCRRCFCYVTCEFLLHLVITLIITQQRFQYRVLTNNGFAVLYMNMVLCECFNLLGCILFVAPVVALYVCLARFNQNMWIQKFEMARRFVIRAQTCALGRYFVDRMHLYDDCGGC